MKSLISLAIASACLVTFTRAVLLDRTLLSEWYPNYRTETYIYLQIKRIDSIASNTFDGLINLEGLWLYYNQLTKLDPTIFKDLINLQGTVLGRIPPNINDVFNLFFSHLVNQLILIRNIKQLLKIHLEFSF